MTTVSYSFYFKRIVLVDVMLLSGLYTLRLLAGAAATGTGISHGWRFFGLSLPQPGDG